MYNSLPLAALCAAIAFSYTHADDPAWQPAPAPLMTRWAKDVSPDRVLPEYPRPPLVRHNWQNLNGLWNVQLSAPGGDLSDTKRPILVPFPVESALSGIGQRAGERLVYHHNFRIPADWQGQGVRLHFGAVDWEATVHVNQTEVGRHQGGYDPFSFDITAALNPEGDQQLRVDVYDPTDAGFQPHGKQHLKPEGIWYTPTTGIWQTVWLEPLPASSIARLNIQPDVATDQLHLQVEIDGPTDELTVEAVALDADRAIASATGDPGADLTLAIPQPQLWSPDHPHLYDLKVTLRRNDQTVDEVASYFGMRHVEIKPVQGVPRLVLNGEPLFQVGPLDQGFWPDGLYTAPTDEALRYDIEVTRQLGYNMTRKHVKVEPARWYYWCDKHGLLVWQDMPHAHHAQRNTQHFELELQRMVNALRNHPSIVMWVVFNEGWGQHRTEHFTQFTKQLDPHRLVSNASGWNDKNVGDIIDIHAYPGPRSPQPETQRAAVLGEFGGLGLAIEGHTWQDKNWSYRGTAGRDELTLGYVNLLKQVYNLQQSPGLSAAVYTQITDVEGEINGLLTYDRAVIKVDVDRVAAANRGSFPSQQVILPTAQDDPNTWQYTTTEPAAGWYATNFDDTTWSSGAAGFGTQGTPSSVVRTTWSSNDIWLRREIELPELGAGEYALEIHHDEDVEVYINGTLAAKAVGYTTSYVWLPLNVEGKAALRAGRNLIAVHCRQTGGGQYVDLGLVRINWSQ